MQEGSEQSLQIRIDTRATYRHCCLGKISECCVSICTYILLLTYLTIKSIQNHQNTVNTMTYKTTQITNTLKYNRLINISDFSTFLLYPHIHVHSLTLIKGACQPLPNEGHVGDFSPTETVLLEKILQCPT